ncbi:NAD(P)-dependent oxidoreductase [Streptomyces spiralis]|uniref:NAD(P)-dependent oxidoreductase n=1 Tax=Streptomyces spiralis TaxID=66376 RepID=UPI0033CA636B
MTVVGILHPGSMGAAVAAQAGLNGAEVLWCPVGRSSATRERAQKYGLTAVSDLAELTARADFILSICPPAHAEDVAVEVSSHRFTGIYVDGNAISPASMARVHAIVGRTGATVVDGSVIGSPPSASKTARLYLSGPADALTSVASLFERSAVHVRLLSGGSGRASALKLSYTSYQKASRVLAAVSYALARDYGVEEELLDIAQGRSTSYLAETAYIRKVAARAWRWGPEMREVAYALREAGLPADLAEASAAVMSRWDDLKDSPLDIPQALERLHRSPASEPD